MPNRVIAIGDIHGCADALDALLRAISPDPTDTVVTLGDYIDRGPDSRRVLEILLAHAERCQLIPLLGNHEEALIDALRDVAALKRWLVLGGAKTLRSYGWVMGGARRPLADWIPDRHWRFLETCRQFHETPTHMFLHAGYEPTVPLPQQSGLALRWRVTDGTSASAHDSGKVAVVGHTPQSSGEILDLGFLVCIDTNCVRGGWLTALDTTSGRIWQSDRTGVLRG